MPSKNKNKKAKKSADPSNTAPPEPKKDLSGDSHGSEEANSQFAHDQLKRLLSRTLYENKKCSSADLADLGDTWPQNIAAAEELMSGFVDISCGVPSLMDALPFVVPGRDSHKTEIKIDAEEYEEYSYDEEDASYASHGAPLCFKQSDSEKLLSLFQDPMVSNGFYSNFSNFTSFPLNSQPPSKKGGKGSKQQAQKLNLAQLFNPSGAAVKHSSLINTLYFSDKSNNEKMEAFALDTRKEHWLREAYGDILPITAPLSEAAKPSAKMTLLKLIEFNKIELLEKMSVGGLAGTVGFGFSTPASQNKQALTAMHKIPYEECTVAYSFAKEDSDVESSEESEEDGPAYKLRSIQTESGVSLLQAGHSLTRLLKRRLIKQEDVRRLESFEWCGSRAEQVTLVHALVKNSRKMIHVLYRKVFDFAHVRQRPIQPSTNSFLFSASQSISDSYDRPQITEIYWKDVIQEKKAYLEMARKLTDLFENFSNKAKILRKVVKGCFCQQQENDFGYQQFRFRNEDSFMLGFFYLFVYKDFILRDVIQILKEHLPSTRERHILDLINRGYGQFMESDLTTWVHLLLHTDIFLSYQTVAARNESVNPFASQQQSRVSQVDENRLYKKLNQDNKKGGGLNPAVIETRNFRRLQKRYVKGIFLPFYRRVQAHFPLSNSSVAAATGDYEGVPGQIHHFNLMDSDFDPDEDADDDEIAEILSSNPSREKSNGSDKTKREFKDWPRNPDGSFKLAEDDWLSLEKKSQPRKQNEAANMPMPFPMQSLHENSRYPRYKKHRLQEEKDDLIEEDMIDMSPTINATDFNVNYMVDDEEDSDDVAAAQVQALPEYPNRRKVSPFMNDAGSGSKPLPENPFQIPDAFYKENPFFAKPVNKKDFPTLDNIRPPNAPLQQNWTNQDPLDKEIDEPEKNKSPAPAVANNNEDDDEEDLPAKKKRKNRRKNKRRKKTKEGEAAGEENSESQLDASGCGHKQQDGNCKGETAELAGQGDCAQEYGVSLFAGDGVTLQNDTDFEEYLKSFELRLGRQPVFEPYALPADGVYCKSEPSTAGSTPERPTRNTYKLRPNFSSKWLSDVRKRSQLASSPGSIDTTSAN